MFMEPNYVNLPVDTNWVEKPRQSRADPFIQRFWVTFWMCMQYVQLESVNKN